MAYEKHPYKGVPGVPNLRLKYIVAGGQLRRQALGVTGYKDETVIPIEKIVAKRPPRGFLKAAFNNGDVGISTPSQSYVFKNVQNVRGFLDAIESKAAEGELKDVGEPEAPSGAAPGDSWNEEYELQPVLVDIPAIPRILFSHLRAAAKDQHGHLLQWKVGPGDWAKAGDVVAEFQVPPIKAVWWEAGSKPIFPVIEMPCDGVVRNINAIGGADWEGVTLDEARDQRKRHGNTLFTVQVARKEGGRLVDFLLQREGNTAEDFREWQSLLGYTECAYRELSCFFAEHESTRNYKSAFVAGNMVDSSYMNSPGWERQLERDPEIFARIILKRAISSARLIGDRG